METKHHIITEAHISDCEEILALQKICYLQEAAIYNDYSIQPLTQTIEEAKKEFMKCIFLKCVREGLIIGSIRAFEEDNICRIGKLIVHPDFQNNGIGRELMNHIENCFSNSEKFELFTGSESSKNISLYQKLGYSIFKKEKHNDVVELIFMEKINQRL